MKTKIFDIFLTLALAILVPFVAFDTIQEKCSAFAESASAQKSCYARVEVNGPFGADFFNDNKSESLFQIPNHYYVLATGTDGDFFKVTYKNELSGFVRKSDVRLVEGTPSSIFPALQLSARNNSMLYSKSNDSSQSTPLNNADALVYFGEKQGAGLQTDKFGSTISTWYYVRTSEFNYGYIYINDVTAIPNVERAQDDPDLLLPAADPKFFDESIPTNFSGLSLGTQIMLIFAIGIPSLLILYFLIKPTKIMQASKSKNKNQKKTKKRVSHGDYFEFDESEL